MKKIDIPITKSSIVKLNAGEELLFSGLIYTARDQAHKRLIELIAQNKKLPFSLEDKVIYYCGPTETPKGKISGADSGRLAIGSCGPTTSSRMDNFVEPLLKKGLLGMIGKGRRAKKVRAIIKKYKAVYFVAPAGCGALLAKKVLSKKTVCFKELGPEAVYELKVKDFPLIVAIDSRGRSIYENL